MLRLRILVSLVGTLLVFALLAAGCASDDDESKAAAAQPAGAEEQFTSGFRIDSASFQQKVRPHLRIPPKNSCFGDNLSPPLEWTGAPEASKSFALLVDDVDHETETWIHWVLYNIPADVTSLPEGIPTSTAALPDGTTQGTNDNRDTGYNGPCPPPTIIATWDTAARIPPHNYEFKLYALDTELGLAPGATMAELKSAMEGHILAEVTTRGKFTAPVQKVNKQREIVATQTAEAATK